MTLKLHYNGFEQCYRLDDLPFIPRIFLAEGEEEVSEIFNAVCICLPLGVQSNLKWEKEKKLAQNYVQKGLKLVFEFDFGLYEKVESDLLTLQLGIDQFKQSFDHFLPHTMGAIVYRGEVPVENVLNFLKILISALPDEMIPFLLLESSTEEKLFSFLSLEDIAYFHLAVKGHEKWPYAIPAMGFEQGSSPLGFFSRKNEEVLPSKVINEALLLHPEMNLQKELPKPIRFIPEWALTESWEGVDTLYIEREKVSKQGLRKVLGFQAAGGRVIEL